MVFERKFRVGIEDIQSICLECHKCKARIVVSPDANELPPWKCPMCSVDWSPLHTPGMNTDRLPARTRLLMALQNLRKTMEVERNERGATPNGFRVILEFEDPQK